MPQGRMAGSKLRAMKRSFLFYLPLALLAAPPLAACGADTPSSKTAADSDEDSTGKSAPQASAAADSDAGSGPGTSSPGAADDSSGGPKKDECTVLRRAEHRRGAPQERLRGPDPDGAAAGHVQDARREGHRQPHHRPRGEPRGHPRHLHEQVEHLRCRSTSLSTRCRASTSRSITRRGTALTCRRTRRRRSLRGWRRASPASRRRRGSISRRTASRGWRSAGTQ